jgi:hypothetical protein
MSGSPVVARAGGAPVDPSPGSKRPRLPPDFAAAVQQVAAAAAAAAASAALEGIFSIDEKEGSPYVADFGVSDSDDPDKAEALRSFRAVDQDCSNMIDEHELKNALEQAGAGVIPLSLTKLIVRVFDENKNGGLDWGKSAPDKNAPRSEHTQKHPTQTPLLDPNADEYRNLYMGIKKLIEKLSALQQTHVSAGLTPEGAAPSPDHFFFTRDELGEFLERNCADVYGPSIRALAIDGARWSEIPGGWRLPFPDALKLLVQLHGMRSAGEEEQRRFFSLC